MPAPQIKPWTVMLYLVAEPTLDPSDLDGAVRAEVQGIAGAAARFLDRMHVAVQVDFNQPPGIFRQIMDGSGYKDLSRSLEEQESTPGDHRVLRRFLTWAREHCPAERYAVFFWGHSLGPGGMFKAGPNGPIVSPEVLLRPALIRELLARYRIPSRSIAASAAEAEPTFEEGRPPAILTLPELASALEAVTGEADKHVDLLVLKDCFMSTLETAYELARVADFQIGCQSLVPIYRRSPSAAPGAPSVWPYHALFEAMTPAISSDAVRDIGRVMAAQLEAYYSRDENLGSNSEVPYTLLDLRAMDDVIAPLDRFVSALGRVDPDSRRRTIAGTSAGDPALVDVLTMCKRFKTLRSAVALRRVIAGHIVAHASRTDAFSGLSLFYRPPQSARGLEGVVMKGLFPLDYADLRLSEDARWNELAFENAE